jgi:hypothetical protein
MSAKTAGSTKEGAERMPGAFRSARAGSRFGKTFTDDRFGQFARGLRIGDEPRSFPIPASKERTSLFVGTGDEGHVDN